MAEKIPQHFHCQMCGKAIPLSETLCSDECKQKYELRLKKRKRQIYLFYAFIIIMVAMLFITSYYPY